MKRMEAGLAIALSALLLPSLATAQTQPQSSSGGAQVPTTTQQDSLADYARKIRKDTPGEKSKPKVFDNDNLPREDKLSVVGEARPADADSSSDAKPEDSTANSGSTPAPGADAKPGTPQDDQAKKQAEWKVWQDKIGQQKDQIDLLTRELDVLQREYQLRAAAMYADAGNRLRNSSNWDKEDAQYKQKIADKQKQVDDAKQKLDDMQDEARKAGVPSSQRE